MAVVKKIWNKHYYSICFFAFLLIYSLTVPTSLQPWHACNVSLAFHAVDFSMGFCSKILPGAIYNIFFDSVTFFKVTLYESILLILFFVAVSVLLEKVMLSIDSQYKKSATIMMLFFLTGPVTFGGYVKQMGMIDVYWLFLTAFFLFALYNKKTRLLLPIIAVLCVAVHYSAIICFVPFFALLILYKASCTDDKKEKKLLNINFFVTVILSLASTVYFVIFEKKNLTYSREEFDKILLDRGVLETNLNYYDFAFYNYSEGNEEFLSELEMNFDLGYLFDVIWQQIGTNQTFFKTLSSGEIWITAAFIFALIVPLVVFVFKAFVTVIKKNKENKIKVFSLVCMMLLPVATLGCCFLFSTDLIRWILHAFLPLFVSFIFVLYYEGKEMWKLVHEKISAVPSGLLIIYFMVYSLSVFDPYLYIH